MNTIRLLALLALLGQAGCMTHANRVDRGARPARINHLAFFKLNDPSEAAALIRDCDEKLAPIPGVVAYYCGRHLDTGRGERVDGNYDVGFYVGFMTEEDLAGYVVHPDHQALVKKWMPRLQWLRVHDVLDETP